MQSDNKNPVFSQVYRVYYEDTDAGGVIYHSNYLKFMERVRTEWLRSFGYSQHELAKEGLLFVVYSIALRYLAPGRLDDELIVTATVKEAKRASFVFFQQIYKQCADGDNVLLCEGDVRLSLIDGIHFKSKPLPVGFIDKFLS
ncbi:4-hydroxybenzoyl-CoA thioesterase [Gammaproteobacteria bacterium ESL0073]|nr:4-hydroxybenzoyl-CoA thioesterase [Gammaproteobacteria bacterium ESL0073]